MALGAQYVEPAGADDFLMLGIGHPLGASKSVVHLALGGFVGVDLFFL